TIDVEDWFQAENLKTVIHRDNWNTIELRVEQNTHRILDFLDKHRTKATFFVLCWIEEKLPFLIREIHKRGHEISSHGYAHKLIYNQSFEEFRADLRHSKDLLENIVNEAIIGYRAPVFSITDWALDILQEEGFKYDSSFFPVFYQGKYGKIKTNFKVHNRAWQIRSGLYEFSLPTLDFFYLRFPWSGGYLRGIPYLIFRQGIKRIVRHDPTYVFYFHPWEIDYLQPRQKNIRLSCRLKHYIGLKNFESKINRLLIDFPFTRIKDGLL
ncbi:MAG: DUF3473 domain-containing protein, partial [Candidatus Omnitrophica bacterium]|nr:DUF3473 domain-containing protein [Candidatus Omnitrophota bacterium]